jgi:hypothetical protein
MRIVSPFHDYYDRALAYGHDDRLVFVRQTQRIDPSMKEELKPFSSLMARLPGGGTRQTSERTLSVDTYLVVVGTKAYPAAAVKIMANRELQSVRIAYSSEDFKQYVVTQGFELENPQPFWYGRRNFDHLTAFLDRPQPEVPMTLLAEKRIALMLVSDGDVVINPSLKQFEFFRCLAPTEVFQELEMFLGGVLAPENRPTVAIEDKYRIAQHGFDRYSFRQSPTKPRKAG